MREELTGSGGLRGSSNRPPKRGSSMTAEELRKCKWVNWQHQELC
jgi:hypothetical protein